MNVFYRLFRTASFLPLAFAGLLSVLAAQTTIILGAIFFGMAGPALRKTPREASAQRKEQPDSTVRPTAVPDFDTTVRADPQTVALLPLVPIVPDSLILLRGEQCYLQERARLVVRDADGIQIDGAAGFSMRRRSDSGAKGGKAHSSDGRVYVTNTRIVFIGASNVNMHIAQILTLDPTPTGVALSFVSEKPMDFVTGNARIAYVLRKVISRLSEAGSSPLS